MKAAEDAGIFSLKLNEGAINEDNPSLEEILNFGAKKQPSVDLDNAFNITSVVVEETVESSIYVTTHRSATKVVQRGVETSADGEKVKKSVESPKPIINV